MERRPIPQTTEQSGNVIYKSEKKPQATNITQNKVTQLFNVRTAIWGAEDIDSLIDICDQFNISSPNEPEINQKIKKQIFNSYFEQNFPTSQDIKEHETKLNNSLNELIKHFTFNQSNSIFITFGSFANGKISSPHSDIDFIVILPKMKTDDEVNEEIYKIESLKERGFVFSEELGPFENLKPILKTGKGLTRLYSMTEEGLETEYHLIGIDDAHSLNLRRKSIERVAPTSPKVEIRISFTGERKGLIKPTNCVQNFVEEDGEMYKGFFTDNVATGDIIYDKNLVGEKIREKLWMTILKRFIYFNCAYDKRNRIINFEKINFEKFLNTLYHFKKEDYSPQRLAELERHYYLHLSRLASSHNLKIE